MGNSGERVRTAVIGVGYLGKFHAQKFASIEGSELVGVSDVDPQRCQSVASEHGVQAIGDYRELLGQVDAVSIVVPTPLHYEVALPFLQAGVHVLLEKPITSTVAEAQALIDAGKVSGALLQVGHLERFNPAVVAMRERTRAPQFFEANRVAPFKERGIDVNVVLDLMIHDIDIVRTLAGAQIESVVANGTAVFSDKPDIVNARLQFTNGCVANLTASRVSAKTERSIRLFQSDTYMSADLNSKQLKVYHKRDTLGEDGWPQVDLQTFEHEASDALMEEAVAFIAAIQAGCEPPVTGEEATMALQTAIQISEML